MDEEKQKDWLNESGGGKLNEGRRGIVYEAVEKEEVQKVEEE